MSKAIVCSFEAVDMRGQPRTYAAYKAAALKAGRFSCFEATASDTAASAYTRLCADPEIETFDLGYPWTGVRLKERK